MRDPRAAAVTASMDGEASARAAPRGRESDEHARDGVPAASVAVTASRIGKGAPAGVDCVAPTPGVSSTVSPAEVEARLSSAGHHTPAAALVSENETVPYCEVAVTV